MNQYLESLKNFEEDSEWFHQNIDKLQESFSGQFIAIKNKKTIAADKKIDVVIEAVEKQKENPSLIFIEFVYPKGYMLLL